MGFGDTQAIAKPHVFIVLCRGFILFSLCLYMNKSSIVTTDCISHAYEFCINPIVVIIVRCTAFLVLVSWIKRSRLFWRLLSMPLVIWNSAFDTLSHISWWHRHFCLSVSLFELPTFLWFPWCSMNIRWKWCLGFPILLWSAQYVGDIHARKLVHTKCCIQVYLQSCSNIAHRWCSCLW